MSRPRILLVDDDRRVRQLVGLTLLADDYELSFAPDGAAAIQAVRAHAPDLILLDFAMPGIDGVDVCAAVRANPTSALTPIVMLTGHDDDEIRERAVQAGVDGFLTKPFSPLMLEQTIRGLIGASNLPAPANRTMRPRDQDADVAGRQLPASAAPSAPGTNNDPAPALFDTAHADALCREQYAELQDTFLSTIEALATALELRGAQTEGHSQRVSLYTVAAARRLGVPGDELEQLRWGAILHDVGMISVPDAILLKPVELHPDEWALIKRHPEHGARLLDHIPGLGVARAIVRFHHERFDGAGYPLGLRGTAIPLGARIFAVADALDAITTDRPYRPTRTWEQARVEILQGRGSHFDPTVVDAFLEIFDDLQGLTAAEHPVALYA